MLEKDVEKEGRQYGIDRGCKTYKLNGPGDVGKPDRFFGYRNRVLFIEFKKPGEEPTDKQWREIHEWREKGFTADYADTPGKAKNLIDKFIRATDKEHKILEAAQIAEDIADLG